MNLAPEVKKQIRIMALGCAACALLVLVGFVVFDKFSIQLVLGTVVGYLLAIGNFYFMSIGVTLAVETGEEIAAKRKLRVSYAFRTVGILTILVASIILSQKYGVINWIPVAAGVFYVRIVIAAMSVVKYFKLKNAPLLPPEEDDGDKPESDDPEEDEEAEEDEFEKFVGHFAKGPVPGKDTKEAKDGKKDNKEETK